MTLAGRQLVIGSGARTVFGCGSIQQLPAAVLPHGTRAFLVTDPGLVAGGVAATVGELLRRSDIEVRVFSDLRPNPGIAEIEAGARALREFGSAVVVGLGGGTSLDGAKAIALAAPNDVPIRDLDYRNVPRHPGFPVVAVPTTAGTGSETNSFAVIDDHQARRKVYVGHASVAPKAAVLDPDLTIGLPPGATAATGVDVLTHSLESLMAKHPDPFAHALDLEVIGVVGRWLVAAVEDGSNAEARAHMLLAAHMAGLAFANTGLGLAHALGHTLSAQLGTPHGVALSVFLPAVMGFNEPHRRAELRDAARVLGSDNAVEHVRALAARIGMPSTLGALGLRPEGVQELVSCALEDVVLQNNPVTPTRGQLTGLVESLL